MSSSENNAFSSYEWGRAGYGDGSFWGELGYSDYQAEKTRNQTSTPSPRNDGESGGIGVVLLCAAAALVWYAGARAFYLHYLMGIYFASYPSAELALMVGAFAMVQLVCLWCVVAIFGWAWSIIAIPALLPPLYPLAIFAGSLAADRWVHFGRFRDHIASEFYAGRFPVRLDRWITHRLDDSGLAAMQTGISDAMAGYALLLPCLVAVALVARRIRRGF